MSLPYKKRTFHVSEQGPLCKKPCVPIALPYITADLKIVDPSEEDHTPVLVSRTEKKIKGITKDCKKNKRKVVTRIIPNIQRLTVPRTQEDLAAPAHYQSHDETSCEPQIPLVTFKETVEVQTYNCHCIPKRLTKRYRTKEKAQFLSQKKIWRAKCTAYGFTHITTTYNQVYKERFVHRAWNEAFTMKVLVRHIDNGTFPKHDNLQNVEYTRPYVPIIFMDMDPLVQQMSALSLYPPLAD